MMGCFSTSKSEKRSSSLPESSQPRTTVQSKSTRYGLLSNKPVELPDPRSLNLQPTSESAKDAETVVAATGLDDDEITALADHTMTRGMNRTGRRAAFSGPLMGASVYYSSDVESHAMTGSTSRVLVNYMSSDETKKSCSRRTLRRATSFGGRPQPLPLPAMDEDMPQKPKQMTYLPLPTPEDATPRVSSRSMSSADLRLTSGTSLFAPSSRTRSFKLEDGPGSRSTRKGRVTPVGGLPLPPPSVASKLLPGLPTFEFSDLMIATENFAANYCLQKGAFGAVYSARLNDSTRGRNEEVNMAVLRLPESFVQGPLEWKAQIQLLLQLSNPNVCAIKGYCTHDEESSVSIRERRQERLLVFEQPAHGSLYDHLFGSRDMTYLDWDMRINIALGAAHGLLYIHDRAPLQILYKEFKASNVLLDQDYTPKLAGYGLSVAATPISRNHSFTMNMMLSQTHAKNNVWSFGIFLLELLTGKNSQDVMYFGDDNNFLQWGRKFMKEESKLSLIIDPRMKGVYPIKGVVEVVNLLLQCANKKDVLRPSMSEVSGTLKVIKAKYCSNSKTPSCGILSPQMPERRSRDSPIFTDMQTSSDASSSENEDTSISKVSPHAFRGARSNIF